MSALFSVLPAANALIRRLMLDPGAFTRILRDPNLVVVDGVWFNSETIEEEEEEDGCSEAAKLEGRLVAVGVAEVVEEEEEGRTGAGAAARGVGSVRVGCEGATGAGAVDSASTDSRSSES